MTRSRPHGVVDRAEMAGVRGARRPRAHNRAGRGHVREESGGGARRCRCSITSANQRRRGRADQFVGVRGGGRGRGALPRALSREMGGGGGGGLGGGSMDRRPACARWVRNASGEALWTRLGAAMDVARRECRAWHCSGCWRRSAIPSRTPLSRTTREKGETSDTTDRPSGRRPTPCEPRSRSVRAQERCFSSAHGGIGEGRVVGRVPASRVSSRGDARRSREGERRVRAERRGSPAVRRDGLISRCFSGGRRRRDAYL